VTVRSFWSAHAAAPLQLTRSRALGEAASTLPYVPGTALRGALAASAVLTIGGEDPAFQHLIEGSIFGNLHPVGEEAKASVPLPRSCVTCSRLPGFLGDGGHGVGDLLLPAEAALLRRRGSVVANVSAGSIPVLPDVDLGHLLVCPRCGEEGQRAMSPPTLVWSGFLQWLDNVPSTVSVRHGVVVQRPAATRRGVGTGNASVGHTLRTGQRFGGTVTFPTGDAAATATAILRASDGMLWVGAGRSRGLGTLHIEVEELGEEPDDLPARYDGMMAALMRAVGRAGGAQLDGQAYVSLTLQSAALLADAFGRWQVALDGDWFARRCGLPGGSLQVRQAFVGSTPIEGWNAALDLPKPDAVALAAGSCWLFRLQGITPAEALAALTRLEREGIGERRQEGFGVVRACDPTHWQLQELEQEQPE
jgi:hypothetical protein